MSLGGVFPILLHSHCRDSSGCLAVRIVECAQLEHALHGAAHSAVQRLVGEGHHLGSETLRQLMFVVIAVGSAGIGFLGPGNVHHTADHVDARMVHRKADALGSVQLLNAPGHVVYNARVGIHVALKAQLTAQQTVDKGTVEGESVGLHGYFFAVHAGLHSGLLQRRLGIIGHYGGNIFIDCRTEWRQMILHEAVFGGIYVPLAHLVMGIKAVFAGSAAGEMLYGERHAIIGHSLVATLNCRHDDIHNTGSEFGVLAKGAVIALPAGIGQKVRHVHVTLADAHCVPVAADSVRPLTGHIHGIAAHCRRNAQRTGPAGEYAGGVVHAEYHLAVLVAGVGHYLHGHEMFTFLSHGLQLVHPVDYLVGLGALAEYHVSLEQLLYGIRGAGRRLLAEDGLHGHHSFIQQTRLVNLHVKGSAHSRKHGIGQMGVHAHTALGGEELTYLLVHGKLLHISLSALLRGIAPVVDLGDHARTVNILEIKSVLLDYPA